jgi:hypothetical protein
MSVFSETECTVEMDFILVRYSPVRYGLPNCNRSRLQGNIMTVNHMWHSMCSVPEFAGYLAFLLKIWWIGKDMEGSSRVLLETQWDLKKSSWKIVGNPAELWVVNRVPPVYKSGALPTEPAYPVLLSFSIIIIIIIIPNQYNSILFETSESLGL